MITVTFLTFGAMLAVWTALFRVVAAKLAGTSFGPAIAFVTP